MINLKGNSVRLFLFYLVFAGIATVVDLSVLFLLTEYGKLFYLYSSAISYCCGMVTNYSLNKKFNFKNKSKKIASQFGVFLFVALIGLAINQIILFILVENGLWYMFSKLISIAVVTIWSFYGHKKFTFGMIR